MVSMSSSSSHFSSLLCYELTILNLKSLRLDLPSHGNLFIRYHFKPGSGKTFRVDTKSIPCNLTNSIVSLNHKALFECRVNSIEDRKRKKKKKNKSVMLELRWKRKGYSVFGLKMPTESMLLARVEVPWKDDLEERWVKLEQCNRELRGKKEIEVLVEFRVWEKVEEIGRKAIECDCQDCRFGWKGGDGGDDAYF